ncbi:MAG TPA: hypothetical protein VF773_19310 [Verrucomicrobiae bacterium]
MGNPIRIIGGGLAGLTLGILLRRDGVPVELWDSGTYPRKRVCGEFISGRGLTILRDLLPSLPTPSARTVQFFNENRFSQPLELPEEALAVDRAQLDHTLALEFQRAGGILRENSRWTESFEMEGVVRATGRRLRKGAGMLGVKIHAANVSLQSDLELHFANDGYVGLSRLPNGEVNICALFRDSERLRKTGTDRFAQIFSTGMGSAFERQLGNASFVEDTFCAVAGISLRREQTTTIPECRIGDSICMIPPLTGNGMSIALETAALAAPILHDYCHGRFSWCQCLNSVSTQLEKLLRRRLAAAGLIQKLCFSRGGRTALLHTLRFIPRTLHSCFWSTR